LQHTRLTKVIFSVWVDLVEGKIHNKAITEGMYVIHKCLLKGFSRLRKTDFVVFIYFFLSISFLVQDAEDETEEVEEHSEEEIEDDEVLDDHSEEEAELVNESESEEIVDESDADSHYEEVIE